MIKIFPFAKNEHLSWIYNKFNLCQKRNVPWVNFPLPFSLTFILSQSSVIKLFRKCLSCVNVFQKWVLPGDSGPLDFKSKLKMESQKATVSCKMSELHLHDALTSEIGSSYHMSIIQLSVTLTIFLKKTRGFEYDRYIYSVLLTVCKLFLWIRNCDEIILFEIIFFLFDWILFFSIL